MKTAHTRQQKKRKVGALSMVMATIAALFAVNAPVAVAVTGATVGGFEIEGNEVVDGGAGALDWKNVPSTILTDASSPDDGLAGSSKENEPLGWTCQTKDPFVTPGKDNLVKAYVSQQMTVSSALLDLAFVREKVTGDTHINFELDKGAITFNSFTGGACPYTGRQAGDLLIAFDFPGSGGADVNAYIWNGTDWGSATNLGQSIVAATDNPAAITAANDIGGLDLPVRAFGEAAIDLVALDQVTPGQLLSCPGFGHVSIRSRSSGQSFNAGLQDVMGGDIDVSTCGKVIVHKTDDAGSPLAGANFGLYPTHADAQNRTNAAGSCTSIADGTCTFNTVTPGTYFVSETPPAPAPYALDPTVVGPITVGLTQTVNVTSHTFVDPRDTGFVKVTKALVDQAGATVVPGDLSTLNGATFLLYQDANADNAFNVGEAVHVWPNPPADGTDIAGCTITNSLGYCSFGPVATGVYRLTETFVPAQTNKGPDITVTVTAGTGQTPVNVTYTNSLSPLQISLDKTGPPTANIGDVFDYTFAVTTAGPPLHDILVAELAPFDNRCNNGPIAGPVKSPNTPAGQDAFLVPGETWTYTCSHLTTPADGTSLLNQARATGTDDFGRTISADDTATVTILYPELSVVKTAFASPVDSGSSAGFTITTTNNGPGAALDVTLSDTLPAGTWTIGGAAAASCNSGVATLSGTLTCSFGTLANGASKVVTLTRETTINDCGTLHNSVTVATTYGVDKVNIDSDTGNNTSSADVVVNCPDVEVHKTAEASPINAGDTARFTIAVRNLGSGSATGVTVSDVLPGAGLTWAIDSQSAAMGCTVGASVSCGPFNLAPDETKTVVISAVTTPVSCGTLPNTVTIAVAGGDINADNNTASASTAVLCPSLGVTKVADAASVSAGDPIGFTITVSNGALPGGTASAVGLNDPLPTGVTWTIAVPVTGCSITADTLVCTPRDLAAGQSLSVQVTATTTEASCATYPNTATADGSNTSPVTATAATSVLCPGLNLTKTAGASPVDAGDPIDFTITVTNMAGANVGTAKDVVLSDPLPAGVTWTIAVPVTGCSITANVLSCTARDLAPGGSLTVQVTATTTEASCATYPNTATADGSNTGPLTASASTTVQCPNLGVTKTADAVTVDAGNPIGFTVTATNAAGDGVGTAKRVTIHDPLPSGAGISWSVESTSGLAVTCAVAAGVLDCGPVDLAPDQSFSVHVVSATPGGLTDASLPAACKVYDNTATADASNFAPLTASASTEVLCPLATTLLKDGPATAIRGDTVKYTLTVTNTGKAGLVSVGLTDPMCDTDTIVLVTNGDGDAILNIGESWTFSCTRVVRADDPDPLPNTATVVGSDVNNRTTTAQGSHVIDIVVPSNPPEVLGAVFTREEPAVSGEALARTGADLRIKLLWAGAALNLGALLLSFGAVVRRRRLT